MIVSSAYTAISSSAFKKLGLSLLFSFAYWMNEWNITKFMTATNIFVAMNTTQPVAVSGSVHPSPSTDPKNGMNTKATIDTVAIIM